MKHLAPPRGRMRKAPGGFTLLEILTVVGIIAALAALLLPVLQSTRAITKRAACQAKLRSIGVALLRYAADHKQTFPFREGQVPQNSQYTLSFDLVGRQGIAGYLPWDGTSRSPYWSNALLCPADPNRALYESRSSSEAYPSSYLYRQNEGAGTGSPQLPISLLSKPPRQQGYLRWIVMDRGILGATGLVKPFEGGSLKLPEPAERHEPDRRSYRSYWHNGGVNVLYEDGSVAWKNYGESLTD